jgi:predicted phage baseplate assembly protein
LGREPAVGSSFTATYRMGNGPVGNVGATVLGRVVTNLDGITNARNPLPATGGTAPEPIEQVRLYAPQAFRTQERAVTEADYAVTAQRHPDVQRAAATRRWTGSWYTMFVTIDRKGGRAVDEEFENDLRAFLERFRMAGYDLEVDAPLFVPLDIALTVCVAPDYFRSHVKQTLLETFSNTDLPDGRRGFFHPDNFTFGQPVYLSQIIAAAMRVPGVTWVRSTSFQRWGQDPRGELENGVITFGRLEIARLDNDPNEPENGRIEFEMKGGL